MVKQLSKTQSTEAKQVPTALEHSCSGIYCCSHEGGQQQYLLGCYGGSAASTRLRCISIETHVGWDLLALIVSSEATLLGQTSRVQMRSHEVGLHI